MDEDGRRHTATEQPYIHRLSWLGVLAEEMGAGIEFADEVSSLIWGGTKDWDQGDHMIKAAARAGLDLSAMEERLQSETDRLEAEIVKNQADHHSVGHWGVPTCAFEGEPFSAKTGLTCCLAIAAIGIDGQVGPLSSRLRLEVRSPRHRQSTRRVAVYQSLRESGLRFFVLADTAQALCRGIGSNGSW